MLLGVQEDLVGSGHRLTGNQVTEGGVAAFLDRGVEADVVATVTGWRSSTRSASRSISSAISSISGSRPRRRSSVLRISSTWLTCSAT